MKRVALTVALAVLMCGIVSVRADETQKETKFEFQTINFPGDTFTQLLGINEVDTITGYHGANINKGFVLTLPNNFTDENFPGSAQTQVIGFNETGDTDGFYVTAGRHPWFPAYRWRFLHRRLSRHNLQPVTRLEQPPSSGRLLR